MAATLRMKLDGRFKKQAKGVFEKYNFDVGIIENGPHKAAQSKSRGLKSYAGGPARKTSRTIDGTLAGISEAARIHTGINFYTRPFKAKKNKDILKLIKNFFDLCSGRGSRKRLENTLQAVVRNPILRGDYGKNNPGTAKSKGFSRLMIDTGQLFKAIKAKTRLRRVS